MGHAGKGLGMAFSAGWGSALAAVAAAAASVSGQDFKSPFLGDLFQGTPSIVSSELFELLTNERTGTQLSAGVFLKSRSVGGPL